MKKKKRMKYDLVCNNHQDKTLCFAMLINATTKMSDCMVTTAKNKFRTSPDRIRRELPLTPM